MSEKNIWVLFDSITQIQSQPLEHEQLQLAIYKMQKSDLTRFHIWTTGNENWQPLNVFLESGQTLFIKDIETAKKLSQEKTETQCDTQTQTQTQSVTHIKLNGEPTQTSTELKTQTKFDADNLTWSKLTPPKHLNFSKVKPVNHSQRAARHELKIEILLISAKGKTFRSHSKNISLTGTILEDNVPFDYYEMLFDVIVVNRYADNPVHSRVQLKAKTVGEGLTPRLRFENISEDQKKRLTIMLNEYIEKQKSQLTKKSSA